eukprot:gene28650-37864_t
MPKIVAYIRASTDKQDLNHQKLELLEFARKKSINIDEFMEITISSRKTTKQRRVDELVEKLKPDDTLIVTELSRLGRSAAENLDISQHDMNSKIITTLFSLFGELERDLISLRTKEALASKKRAGQVLGKPKGTIQKSKFDKDVEKIKELL